MNLKQNEGKHDGGIIRFGFKMRIKQQLASGLSLIWKGHFYRELGAYVVTLVSFKEDSFVTLN